MFTIAAPYHHTKVRIQRSRSLGFEQTTNQISRNIKVYNELKPHASCDYLTPEKAHLQSEKINYLGASPRGIQTNKPYPISMQSIWELDPFNGIKQKIEELY